MPDSVLLNGELRETGDGVIVTVLPQATLAELILRQGVSPYADVVAEVLPRQGLNMSQERIPFVSEEHVLA